MYAKEVNLDQWEYRQHEPMLMEQRFDFQFFVKLIEHSEEVENLEIL